ncbi:MAG: hypothetical protein H6735_27860 [Alphaproteobacteria bacterium]|nr:hypothetical protein [Alphaproteobacteria bacterium]
MSLLHLLSIGVAYAACPSGAPDWTVCASGCDTTTVADAVTNAVDGEIICVSPGTYTQRIVLGSNRRIRVEADGAVTLSTGSGNEIISVSNGGKLELLGVTVSGNNNRRCITATGANTEVLLHDATIQGCTAGVDGGGVNIQSSARLISRAGTRFLSNTANNSSGGAIYARNATLELTDTTFDNNDADNAGAIRADNSPTTIDGCTFTGSNTDNGNGGAIRSTGTTSLTVTRSSFANDIANDNQTAHGGAICHESSGALHIDYSAFDQCDARNYGGAVYSTSADTVVLRSEFSRCDADRGGGLYVNGITAGRYIANNVFQDNTCGDDGGGAWVSGNVTFQNNELFANDCGSGGGKEGDGVEFAGGPVTFRNNAVSHQARDGAHSAGGVSVTSDYNIWFSNGGNANFNISGELTSNPLYISSSTNGTPDDDFLPQASSPMIDAGDPSLLDTHPAVAGNGTRSDIGIGGGPFGFDADGDGVTWPTDCRDDDPDSKPGAVEIVADGIDQDCDGFDACYQDFDNDGFGGTSVVDGSPFCLAAGEKSTALDCNDTSASINPLAAEVGGDGIDQDCDGFDSCYVDLDQDGRGRNTLVDDVNANNCGDAQESRFGDDCDDTDPNRSPALSETPANGKDNDCDNLEDCYTDGDHDSYGISTITPSADLTCSNVGLAGNTGDCDDTRAAVHPGATEVTADGLDNDCNGLERCFLDFDNDDWGHATLTIDSTDMDCLDNQEASQTGDCNDSLAAVNPGATEVPVNLRDDNCDGTEICHLDADNDGYGVAAFQNSSNVNCANAGVSLTDDDCDDNRPGVNPGASEALPATWGDGIDQDCSGADTAFCIVDADRDGYGTDNPLSQPIGATDGTCDTAQGESTTNDDCDDTRVGVNPGASEVPRALWGDGIDQDCNGADTIPCFVDADMDGDGSDLAIEVGATDGVCNRLQQESLTATDCDDTDDQIYWGAPDTCGDGVDSDCMNPGDNDEDGDGLAYPDEQIWGTNDCDPDSDDDGIGDFEEVDAGMIPTDQDSDNDLVLDGDEYYPAVGAGPRDSDNDGTIDALDTDDDGDGVPTAEEAVTGVPQGGTYGDINRDGIPNHLDPDDDGDDIPTAIEVGLPDGDIDNDGIPNWADTDDDGDGILTAVEIAASANPLSVDSDSDGVPDSTEWPLGDTDRDGLLNIIDVDDDGDTIRTIEEGQGDIDGDQIPNYLDLNSDCDQLTDEEENALPDPDVDDDGILNYRDRNDADGPDGDPDLDGLSSARENNLGARPDDPDFDGDLVRDGLEAPTTGPETDTDGDTIPDWQDDDDDGDGFSTREETGMLDAPNLPACTSSIYVLGLATPPPVQGSDECPASYLALMCGATDETYVESFRDTDGDGIPDYLDPDDDNDGILTVDEDPLGDEDGDGIIDPYDTDPESGPLGDHDGDGVSNGDEGAMGGLEYYEDSDRDGVPDAIESTMGDTDGDGLPNMVDDDDDDDGYATEEEGSGDTDGDGIPDYLDEDSDGDGIDDVDEADGDTDCDGLPERVDAFDDALCEGGPAGSRGQYVRQGCEGCSGGVDTPAVGWLAGMVLVFARRRRRT